MLYIRADVFALLGRGILAGLYLYLSENMQCSLPKLWGFK
jgi:hypothetical protein